MQGDTKTRLLGIIIAAAAIPTFIATPEPLGGALAFGLAVTGAFTAIVVAQRVIPAEAADAMLTGTTHTLTHIQTGMRLQGHPIYVPDQGNIGAPRLFLPTQDDERPVPILTADMTVHGGRGGTKAGMAIPAPGWALAKNHAQTTGTKPATISQTGPWLHDLLRRHDLAASLDIDIQDQGFDITLRPSATKPPCLDTPQDPACQATGCMLCQAIGCTLAETLGQPLRVANAHITPDQVRIRMERTPP